MGMPPHLFSKLELPVNVPDSLLNEL